MNVSWLESQPGTTQAGATLDDLRAVGVTYEHLPLDPDSFQSVLDDLKDERGYVEQDEIELKPDTPNLDGICAKFADEHLHTDDEVRFVLTGEGIFDIRSETDRWIRVVVEAGDLIVVPANLHHRFFLTDRQQIRCVRLFKDSSGWVPHYRQDAPA